MFARPGDLKDETIHLADGLSEASFERSGSEMQDEGIYVELGPWACHFFRCERRQEPIMAVAA